MRTQRAMRFVRVLCVIGACGAVLVPLPADAFELSGGVSFGGIQIGAEPMLAVSPFVGLLWRTEAGFLFEAHNMFSIVLGPREGVYDRTAVNIGYAWKAGKVSVGPSLSILSLSVCASRICDRVEGLAPGGHAQVDWFFFGPLGVSVSGNLDWIVQGSRIVAEGPVGMITAGPVVRLEAR